MALKEHHSARTKKARKAMHCIRRLTEQMAMWRACKRRHYTGQNCGGTTGRAELQKLQNRPITGNFRTTNLGVVMAESGLRPAVSLLNDRIRRHVLRLMSLPKGDQAKTLPGGDISMGQRMVHFGNHSGWVEKIYIPTGGRANGDRRQYLDRRCGVGGAGGNEGGLPTRAGALDEWVAG